MFCKILIVILLVVICALIYLYVFKKQPEKYTRQTVSEDSPNNALVASPGTGITDIFPYLTYDINFVDTWPLNKVENTNVVSKIYQNFINSSLKDRPIIKCDNIERSKLLSYLMGVYYSTNLDNLQKLSDEELLNFYRCLVFYYITSPETQPDGGWYGPYWKNRIVDEGPVHNLLTGSVNMSVCKNESFLFDSQMTKNIPTECPAYQLNNGKCPNHSTFFGDRMFPEMCQSSLRRGMRNSNQVINEKPKWFVDNKLNIRFGTGGFPDNSFVECLQFPEEHGAGGWPSGCDSTTAKCSKENFPSPIFQPTGKTRTNGGNPYCGQKSQWFYFVQGYGQFWNLGVSSYCYNYVDMFLNSPIGIPTTKFGPIGWLSGFGPCTDKLKYPNVPGVLGYDIENPTKGTEHDYNYPAYSMKLILEYISRNDVPGPCKDTSCHNGLRDVRTGMLGLGFCPSNSTLKSCPCVNKTTDDDLMACLNTNSVQLPPGTDPTLDNIGGCGSTQPDNSRTDALNEQVATLMGLKKGTYWKAYALKQIDNLNTAPGVIETLNQYGGFDPTDAWRASRTKLNPKYPIRSPDDMDSSIKDNRTMIVGWVNGHFYGYPKGQYIYYPVDNDNSVATSTPNPYPEGISGTHPQTGDVIYGKPNTKDDPLIYLDMNDKEIYRTWYGKPLNMDEDTALILTAEFYSCGDLGFENFNTNWPFGCYFGYGEALGSPGKSAAQSLSCIPYACTTVQFTSTATAFGSVVQPTYDFEILYMPPVKSKLSNPAECTCATSVSLDLTADFNSDNPGQDLKRYLCMNKGCFGGYVPENSPAGKSAVAFQGQNMKVTNWTTVTSNDGTFDPYKKNRFGVDSNPDILPVCSSVNNYRKE